MQTIVRYQKAMFSFLSGLPRWSSKGLPNERSGKAHCLASCPVVSIHSLCPQGVTQSPFDAQVLQRPAQAFLPSTAGS